MVVDEPDDRTASAPSFRLLELFAAVSRLQSVRQAAKECNISQPGVTQAIAKLEDSLGVQLFERRAQGSYLTAYGAIFQNRTERLLKQVEAALADLGVPATRRAAGRIKRSQVRGLLSIAESGTFDDTSQNPRVSSASAQRAVQELQRDLGKVLCQRTAYGVTATPAGADLSRRLRLAIREIELGVEELRVTKDDLSGRILLGVLQMTANYLLPEILSTFVTSHPKANVHVSNGSCQTLLRSLRAGDVDFVVGLVRKPLPDDLRHDAIIKTPYVVVGRHGHPLANRKKITLDELGAYDWIVGSPGASRRACFDGLFAGRAKPKTRIETYSIPTIRLLLSSSDRLTLLTSVELMYETKLLAALPYGPIEPVDWLGITTRADMLPTSLQASFVDHVKKAIASAPQNPVAARSVAAIARAK